MKVAFAVSLIVVMFAAVPSVHCQFSPALLRNTSYWDDKKAEVDLYDAQVMTDGQLRPCEIMIVLCLDKFTPARTSADQTPPHELPAIVLTKIFTVSTGLTVHQETNVISFSREGQLLSASDVQAGAAGISYTQVNVVPQNTSYSFTHYDGRGATSLAQLTDGDGSRENPFAAAGPAASASPASGPEKAVFLYEELPLRVRTIQFTKPSAEFPIKLTSALSHWTGVANSTDARISYKAGEREIEVVLKKGNETDRFLLGPEFPFLLREWQMADGSHLRLKNSLRVDYRQYLKNGDREKALKDPMLRHPD